MKINTILPTLTAILVLSASHADADPIWATGASLMKVIGYDLQAHELNKQLDDYQTNAVCLLLGYLNGYAECATVTAHYDATALPFVLPDNITNAQLEQIIYKYLSDNPDKLTLKGGVIIVTALSKAYPNPSFSPSGGLKPITP